MVSQYLNRLSSADREALKSDLLEIQHGVCFICGEQIDRDLQWHSLDIDHVVPISTGGKDDPSNFALTHSSCNKSKQDANLSVARVLCEFDRLKKQVDHDGHGVNLGDVLLARGGALYDLPLSREASTVKYCFPEMGEEEVRRTALLRDELSGFEHFFAELPIEYLHYDDKINPRGLGANLGKLVKEFYNKRPQLHVALAWAETGSGGRTAIRIFDGQHKAAAQILLGVRKFPVRVFVDPDLDVLLTANTNAGTTLRQVAFDKSVQRSLGSSLYVQRMERYQRDTGRSDDDFSFSERELATYFRGESQEVKRYILDAVRNGVTHHPENRLRDYIAFSGRTTELPLSYSTIEKTFYSFFIYQDMLNTPIDYRFEEGENPRELEKQQILQLMNIIADEIFIGKFDPAIGTSRIENRIQNHEKFPDAHVIAFRLSKEEVLYNWLRYISQIVKNHFIMQGTPIDESKLFQYRLPETVWNHIRRFVRNLAALPLWLNNELSVTVFGGKQNYDFWQTVFETGKTPQGIPILARPLNLMDMIKE